MFRRSFLTFLFLMSIFPSGQAEEFQFKKIFLKDIKGQTPEMLSDLKGRYNGNWVIPPNPNISDGQKINCIFNNHFQFYHCKNGGYFFLADLKPIKFLYKKGTGKLQKRRITPNFLFGPRLDSPSYPDSNEFGTFISRKRGGDATFSKSLIKFMKEKGLIYKNRNCAIYSKGQAFYISSELTKCDRLSFWKFDHFFILEKVENIKKSKFYPLEFTPIEETYLFKGSPYFTEFVKENGGRLPLEDYRKSIIDRVDY